MFFFFFFLFLNEMHYPFEDSKVFPLKYFAILSHIMRAVALLQGNRVVSPPALSDITKKYWFPCEGTGKGPII